jgi:hypothetical protein
MQHHAYIYEGSLGTLSALATDARGRFNFIGEHDPDVHVRTFEKFGIDESRWLAETAGLKSASGRALFVIGVGGITSEAQQALLKLLEEPQQGTTIVLLAPHGSFVATIRSRALAYPETQPLAGQKSSGRLSAETSARLFAQQAAAFLKASGKDRSAEIAKMLKDKDEEGTKEKVREFVNALELELHAKIADPKVRAGLEDISRVRDYLSDRSPSLKMLLEHLAVALPKI